MRKALGLSLVALAAMAATPAAAQADNFPSRTIRWVVPYAPGGPADFIARLVAQKLSERLGQTVIIDNKAGAAGDIGANDVIRAPADGYTMLYVNPFLITNPLSMKASKDLLGSLKPVILMTSVPMVLIRNPKFPATTFTEVLDAIKKKPGEVTCGSSGAMPMVGCRLLESVAGAEINSVIYRGQAPVVTATMSGEINLAFDMSNTVTPYLEAKQVLPIATTAAKREAARPDIPAIAESVDGVELIVWQGAMVAKDTPDAIVQKLNTEINAVLAIPEIRERVVKLGLTVDGGTPDAFATLIAKDKVRLTDLFKKAKIEPQ